MSSATKQIPKLIKRDGPWCDFCGYELRLRYLGQNCAMAPTREHIVPKALGGKSTLDNLRVRHLFCNAVYGVGATPTGKTLEKHGRFIARLQVEGYKHNGKHPEPIKHNLPIPERFKEPDVRSAFLSLGPLQFDFKWVNGRYWHLRLGTKTYAMTELGSESKGKYVRSVCPGIKP